jgi:hypothetical protein
LRLGVAIGAATTVGLALAEARSGGSAAAVLATTLLCVLLGLVGHFVKQARASQDTTELLLAKLEDAREAQLRAAAIAERGRIASELHDVLAHSLSGAAIQLQGARHLRVCIDLRGVARMEVDEVQAAIAAQYAAEVGDVAPSAEDGQRTRPRRTRRGKAQPETPAPRGSKGEEVFDRVNTLTTQEGINRSQAFQRVAEQSGDRPGTVAANYYRVARKRGGEGIRPRARQARSSMSGGARRGRRSSVQDATRVIREAERALAALTELALQNDQQIAALERENRRYDEVRKILR